MLGKDQNGMRDELQHTEKAKNATWKAYQYGDGQPQSARTGRTGKKGGLKTLGTKGKKSLNVKKPNARSNGCGEKT